MKAFENQYVSQRINYTNELRKLGIDPYTNGFVKEIKNSEFLERFKELINRDEKKDENAIFAVTGRIKLLRIMGKAAFAKIEDESGILQIYYSKNELGEFFDIAKSYIEVGDIIYAKGFPFVTKTGELTLHALDLRLLTKSIVPLPEKFHGLQDTELRYRRRYLDMIMHPEVKERFKLRSKIVSLIRHFFEEKGFLEVETPMMHPIAGGANARPFITHHNALGVDRYLRIAPELYLKRLIVGGFEAIFEINRNFRNEGMDATHNPEFTMIEFYWAYKTYEDLIELTIELFNYLFSKLELPKEIEFDGLKIDFSEFKKIDYIESITTIGGVPKEIIIDAQKIKEFLKSQNIETQKESLGELQAELFDNFVEKKLINPTFVINFPIEISPLARRNNKNPQIADRFELFIAGREIANGFSELNDPLDQLERFKAQMEAKAKGDIEAQEMDEDFVLALGYGMPPTAGEGIGIDRLVMLFTNSHSIRDVILFPAMRPENESNNI